MRVEGGSATVDVGDCLAGIMGQSMGAGEAWDGEIKIEEYIKRVNIGGAIKMAKVDESIGWIIDCICCCIYIIGCIRHRKFLCRRINIFYILG